jgi:hypothetical protein
MTRLGRTVYRASVAVAWVLAIAPWIVRAAVESREALFVSAVAWLWVVSWCTVFVASRYWLMDGSLARIRRAIRIAAGIAVGCLMFSEVAVLATVVFGDPLAAWPDAARVLSFVGLAVILSIYWLPVVAVVSWIMASPRPLPTLKP